MCLSADEGSPFFFTLLTGSPIPKCLFWNDFLHPNRGAICLGVWWKWLLLEGVSSSTMVAHLQLYLYQLHISSHHLWHVRRKSSIPWPSTCKQKLLPPTPPLPRPPHRHRQLKKSHIKEIGDDGVFYHREWKRMEPVHKEPVCVLWYHSQWGKSLQQLHGAKT